MQEKKEKKLSIRYREENQEEAVEADEGIKTPHGRRRRHQKTSRDFQF